MKRMGAFLKAWSAEGRGRMGVVGSGRVIALDGDMDTLW